MDLTYTHISLIESELMFLMNTSPDDEASEQPNLLNCVVDRTTGRMKYNVDPENITDAAWWNPCTDAARDNKQAVLKKGKGILPPADALAAERAIRPEPGGQSPSG